MDNGSSDVVIIGGGVIGLSLAYQLALEGVSVTVLERGQIGQEASSAGAGILAPQAEMEEMSPLTELCLASKNLYSNFVHQLVSKTGIDIEFSQAGLLYAGFSGEEHAELEGRYRWQSALGLSKAHAERSARCGEKSEFKCLQRSVLSGRSACRQYQVDGSFAGCVCSDGSSIGSRMSGYINPS